MPPKPFCLQALDIDLAKHERLGQLLSEYDHLQSMRRESTDAAIRASLTNVLRGRAVQIEAHLQSFCRRVLALSRAVEVSVEDPRTPREPTTAA